MFENFKDHVKFLIDEEEEQILNEMGFDPRYYYYDEDEGVIKEHKRPKKPLYLHIMYAIYKGIMFIIIMNRYIAAGFYWFWSCYKGTVHERHKLDVSAQNYLFVTFVVIPVVMYWYNVYL